jgi:hypothetical protein
MSLLSGSGVGDCRTQQQLDEMNQGLRVPRVWVEGARGGVQGMQSVWGHARHEKGVRTRLSRARRQSPPRSPPAGDVHHDCRVIIVAGRADLAGTVLAVTESPPGGSRLGRGRGAHADAGPAPGRGAWAERRRRAGRVVCQPSTAEARLPTVKRRDKKQAG